MKNVAVYLQHILQAMREILSYEPSEAVLSKDTMMQRAIERNLQIVGEATKRVPEEYKKAHDSIPWKKMAGMRDIIVHNYDEVGLDELWNVVQNDIPKLMKTIEDLYNISAAES